MNKYVIERYCRHTQVFTGIEAENPGEALAKFYRGEGKISPERETWSDWSFNFIKESDDLSEI